MSDPIRRLETPNEKIERLEAELAEAVDAARALDRVRDVMGDYLSDEWVPMSRLLAALDGKTDRG